MVRECKEGLLLAQERKGGYRARCTALIAPSATELLQLLRWISADKKGALNRAGIQLADGCRSLACCYSAPPELDLIRMQPPPQPTWAASDGGGEAAQLPQAGSSGHQGPPAPAAAPLPSLCCEGARERHAWSGLSGAHQPAKTSPSSIPLGGRSPALPSGASSCRVCGGSGLLHCTRPRQHGEHVSRSPFIHRNKLPPMITHVLPFPSTSCHFEVNAFHPNARGFNFTSPQLPPPLCSVGLRCHAALECAAGCLRPDKPPRLLRHVILDNYQVSETCTKNPTAGETVTSSCRFSYVLYLTSFISLLLRLPVQNQCHYPTRGCCMHTRRGNTVLATAR